MKTTGTVAELGTMAVDSTVRFPDWNPFRRFPYVLRSVEIAWRLLVLLDASVLSSYEMMVGCDRN